MTNETRSKPQPKLVWPFLAWNFGWTWGFLLLAIILKNLWPENPPELYLTLEGLLTSLSMFGPVSSQARKGLGSISYSSVEVWQ